MKSERNQSLNYIEFSPLDENCVRADFTVHGTWVRFSIPIVDNGRSYEMLNDMLSLLGKQFGDDFHVFFRPSLYSHGFCLESHAQRLRLKFSSVYVDKSSVMYKLCKSYISS